MRTKFFQMGKSTFHNLLFEVIYSVNNNVVCPVFSFCL
ncbi:MAG: hypothetical protein IEMM0006_1260 [bacterium]|nr:MAG: hypothetical protein IEMM0006_1260 [bacterium]